jgi:hypothetical protein
MKLFLGFYTVGIPIIVGAFIAFLLKKYEGKWFHRRIHVLSLLTSLVLSVYFYMQNHAVSYLMASIWLLLSFVHELAFSQHEKKHRTESILRAFLILLSTNMILAEDFFVLTMNFFMFLVLSNSMVEIHAEKTIERLTKTFMVDLWVPLLFLALQAQSNLYLLSFADYNDHSLNLAVFILLLGIVYLGTRMIHTLFTGYIHKNMAVRVGYYQMLPLLMILLFAKIAIETKFFEPGLNKNYDLQNYLKWILFVIGILSLLFVRKKKDWTILVNHLNFSLACFFCLLLSIGRSDLYSLFFVSIFIFSTALWIQFGFLKEHGESQGSVPFWQQVAFLLSVFLPLPIMNTALKMGQLEINAMTLQPQEWNVLFQFPPHIYLGYMLLLCVFAVFLCKDRLWDSARIQEQSFFQKNWYRGWYAYFIYPLIFLGIYSAPLYNYIKSFMQH